jgi:AcrR family transcriptional regulator
VTPETRISGMSATAPAKTSFKEQMLQAREEAIVQTANRLLAEKGFESMTVDEVAAAVGIAKASLYKHFPSKEDLAAAAMVRVMQRTLDFLASVTGAGQARPTSCAPWCAGPCRSSWPARCRRCRTRTPPCAPP